KESFLPFYHAEKEGLERLRQIAKLRVPKPSFCAAEGGFSFLAMEHIRLASHTPSSHKALGRGLAEMHLAAGPEMFGYETNNALGITPQINTWAHCWIDFFVDRRLQYLLCLLEETRGDTE